MCSVSNADASGIGCRGQRGIRKAPNRRLPRLASVIQIKAGGLMRRSFYFSLILHVHFNNNL
jgi:hypothetical protein